MKVSLNRISQALLLVVLVPVLGSLCSCRSAFLSPFTIPNPFASVDHVQLTQYKASCSVIDTRVKPATAVTGKQVLTLDDCRAMALAHNPDIQIATMEELSKASAAKGFQKKLLPHMVLSTDMGSTEAPRWHYGQPSVWNGTAGTSTGAFELLRGKDLRRYTAELNWSPNEAAQSFFLSRNACNDAKAAHYERVRRAQELIGCVDAAYYRLLGCQESASTALNLVSIRTDMFQKMKDLYEKRLVSLETLNDAHQKMVRARLTLTRMKTETERQRNTLASKVGCSPNYTVDGGFRLAGTLASPKIPAEMGHLAVWDMERTGLHNRPESYRAVLHYLKSANDATRTMLRYIPHITAFFRSTRVEDRLIYDKQWQEVGINAKADLLDLWANVDEVRSARLKRDANEKAFDLVATQVVAQVRDAAFRYFEADALVKTSAESLESARDFLQMALSRETAGDLNKLSVEEARANLLDRTIDANRALAEANACMAELQSCMAVNYNEPFPCF
jgi:outer membrane protein TolC